MVDADARDLRVQEIQLIQIEEHFLQLWVIKIEVLLKNVAERNSQPGSAAFGEG